MKILLISVLVLILIIVFKRNTLIAIRAKMLFAKGDSEGAIRCFARADKGGGLEPEMRLTILACVLCFGLLWAGLLWIRARQLALHARIDALFLRGGRR